MKKSIKKLSLTKTTVMLFKEEQQNNAPAGGKSAWICTGYTRPGMCWLL